jgi:hypothetical protein
MPFFERREKREHLTVFVLFWYKYHLLKEVYKRSDGTCYLGLQILANKATHPRSLFSFETERGMWFLRGEAENIATKNIAFLMAF